MNVPRETQKSEKRKIVSRAAELSRLLGMVPTEAGCMLQEPVTGNEMALSNWLDAARKSFLELSLSISRELDIELR